MAGLLTDSRKTALGALALAVMALWFTDQDGVGGEAVVAADAARQTHRQQTDESPGPRVTPSLKAAPAGWNATEEEGDAESGPPEEPAALPTEPENPPE